MTLYEVTQDDAQGYPSQLKDSGSLLEPENTYLSYTFHQGQVKRKTKSTKQTLYDLVRSFGSLLSFTIRFTVLAISNMQSFSLANSLIKKLYSAD